MKGPFYVYVLTNQWNSVLYTGITNNLARRISEHKQKLVAGFTAKYNIDKLVYAEEHNSLIEAQIREKQIKAGSRLKKIKLIESINKEWRDLSDGLML